MGRKGGGRIDDTGWRRIHFGMDVWRFVMI
jgi:hypothetical protein